MILSNSCLTVMLRGGVLISYTLRMAAKLPGIVEPCTKLQQSIICLLVKHIPDKHVVSNLILRYKHYHLPSDHVIIIMLSRYIEIIKIWPYSHIFLLHQYIKIFGVRPSETEMGVVFR